MRYAVLLLACFFPLLGQQPAPRTSPPMKVIFYAQEEPPGGSMAMNGWNHNRSLERNDTVIYTWAYSASRGVYWGCDVVLQPQPEDGVYLARVRPLSLSGSDLDTKSMTSGKFSHWRLQPPQAFPGPQRIRIGETLAIDLMIDIRNGEKIAGYLELAPGVPIQTVNAEVRNMSTAELRDLESKLVDGLQTTRDKINGLMMAMGPLQVSAPSVREPRVNISGPPKDFSAEDAEMEISAPRVHVAGAQDLSSANSTSGARPWLYLPGRGRFVLSLVPRTGFVQAGEVEGRLLVIKDGSETITLQSLTPIVSEFTPFIVYVRHDRTWQPESGSASELQLGALSLEDPANTH